MVKVTHVHSLFYIVLRVQFFIIPVKLYIKITMYSHSATFYIKITIVQLSNCHCNIEHKSYNPTGLSTLYLNHTILQVSTLYIIIQSYFGLFYLVK